MTPPTPWHHRADPSTPPVEVAREFARTAFDRLDGRIRAVHRFGGRWDVEGKYHGVFVVQGEDGEFELSGDWDGNWKVERICLPFDEADRLNARHLADPQPGDYWNEMFSPICVVVERSRSAVIICKATKQTDPDHWTWDLAKLEAMTLPAFAEWLSFKSEGFRDFTWCRVVPRAHEWVVEAIAKII